jgi:hypothetical protein
MLDSGEIVIYKEFDHQLLGNCGIVEEIVRDEPNYVWVRWVGETRRKKELITNLEVI